MPICMSPANTTEYNNLVAGPPSEPHSHLRHPDIHLWHGHKLS